MKKQQIHILYLPGFGGRYDSLRLRLMKWWRYKDVTVEMVPMRWRSKEVFERKIARIDQAVDRAKGKRIVVIGESAGGSMAVHMYARRPDDLYKVMTVCGKNSHPETVGQMYYSRSPNFRTSMDLLNESIDKLTDEQKRQFVSIHPLYDPVIPIREMLLKDCRRVRLPWVGHFTTIIAALTIFSPLVVWAARK